MGMCTVATVPLYRRFGEASVLVSSLAQAHYNSLKKVDAFT